MTPSFHPLALSFAVPQSVTSNQNPSVIFNPARGTFPPQSNAQNKESSQMNKENKQNTK